MFKEIKDLVNKLNPKKMYNDTRYSLINFIHILKRIFNQISCDDELTLHNVMDFDSRSLSEQAQGQKETKRNIEYLMLKNSQGHKNQHKPNSDADIISNAIPQNIDR
ncbi:hypothetical protein V1477_008146 [Vespula maculifrons]|uniref:Uncharacterized protein n=1 Tax=Vespula maculifrons TaxID=7453 RepID=A0ABD2CC77_VESMC